MGSKHDPNKVKPGDAKASFVNKFVGQEKKKFEKNDVKETEAKSEKKLNGDSGIDCHYYNGEKYLANDCMLRKKEEKKNRVKDEAYYVEKLEEVQTKAKGMSLVARGESEEDGMY